MKNYTEDGHRRMREAGERGGETIRKRFADLSDQKKLDYLANPRHCPECESVIPCERRTNKFCSASCGAKHSNRLKKKVKICKQCDREVTGGGTYCSQKCHKDHTKYQKIEQWLKGEIDVSTVLGCSATIRKYLLDQCNHECPKCGWCEVNPVTGKVPLEINHIDGDSKNNRPENLEVLCPNCHSLTPNFRALNKKSSRTRGGLRKGDQP